MKTAVSLPDTLFHRAEREAARRGLSRSALYAVALEQLVFASSADADPVTAKLNEIYDDVDASGELGAAAVQGWIDDGSWTW